MDRVYVANLPPDIRIKDIDDFFRPFGKLVYIDVNHRANPVYAYVQFDSARNAFNAVKSRHGYDYEGYTLQLRLVENEVRKRRDATPPPPPPPMLSNYGSQNFGNNNNNNRSGFNNDFGSSNNNNSRMGGNFPNSSFLSSSTSQWSNNNRSNMSQQQQQQNNRSNNRNNMSQQKMTDYQTNNWSNLQQQQNMMPYSSNNGRSNMQQNMNSNRTNMQQQYSNTNRGNMQQQQYSNSNRSNMSQQNMNNYSNTNRSNMSQQNMNNYSNMPQQNMNNYSNMSQQNMNNNYSNMSQQNMNMMNYPNNNNNSSWNSGNNNNMGNSNMGWNSGNNGGGGNNYNNSGPNYMYNPNNDPYAKAGFEDSFTRGLSGSGRKWFNRYIRKGLTPDVARSKALEHRNLPYQRDGPNVANPIPNDPTNVALETIGNTLMSLLTTNPVDNFNNDNQMMQSMSNWGGNNFQGGFNNDMPGPSSARGRNMVAQNPAIRGQQIRNRVSKQQYLKSVDILKKFAGKRTLLAKDKLSKKYHTQIVKDYEQFEKANPRAIGTATNSRQIASKAPDSKTYTQLSIALRKKKQQLFIAARRIRNEPNTRGGAYKKRMKVLMNDGGFSELEAKALAVHPLDKLKDLMALKADFDNASKKKQDAFTVNKRDSNRSSKVAAYRSDINYLRMYEKYRLDNLSPRIKAALRACLIRIHKHEKEAKQPLTKTKFNKLLPNKSDQKPKTAAGNQKKQDVNKKTTVAKKTVVKKNVAATKKVVEKTATETTTANENEVAAAEEPKGNDDKQNNKDAETPANEQNEQE